MVAPGICKRGTYNVDGWVHTIQSEIQVLRIADAWGLEGEGCFSSKVTPVYPVTVMVPGKGASLQSQVG